MVNNVKIFLYSALISAITAPVCAMNEAQDDYFSMSLEELLDVVIVTASQQEEKAAESLAVVSVMTAQQLAHTGANTLYEALSFLPGIVLNETYMGYSVLTFRGVTPGLYNTKALFMINGHPAHEKLFGSSHLEYIPLEMVDRIEVVRSPASVLYGTNAVSGVVNVITKKGKDHQPNLSIRVGSNGHLYSSVSQFSEDYNFSASVQKDDGFSYSGTFDELGQVVDKDYKNNLANFYFDVAIDDWLLNMGYFNSEKEKFGLNPINQHGGTNEFESFYLSAKNIYQLDTGTVTSWLRYDYMDRSLNTQQFPDAINGNPITVENKLQRYGGEVNFRSQYSEVLNYILGLSFEFDKTNPFLFVDQTNGSIHPFSPFLINVDSRNFSLYSQIQYQFNPNLAGIIGLRADKNSDTGSALVPRIGLNYRLNDENFLKFLYSEAYRSPAFLEKYADVPGILLGDLTLDRENIQTMEISFEGKLNKSTNLQATLFGLELDNEITRRASPLGGTEYFNAAGVRRHGVELAVQKSVRNNFNFEMNVSYLKGEDQAGNSALFVANTTANLILSYRWSDKWNIGFSSQYIGAKDYVTTTGEVGSVDSYNLSNLTLTCNLDSSDLTLSIRNLFDRDYKYPEPVRRNLSQIPGGDGRNLYLRFSYRY